MRLGEHTKCTNLGGLPMIQVVEVCLTRTDVAELIRNGSITQFDNPQHPYTLSVRVEDWEAK
jgi:hypothetical protein